jgi:hypothetical protein
MKYLDRGFYSRLLKLCATVLVGSLLLKLFGSDIFTHPIFSKVEGYNWIRVFVNILLYSTNVYILVVIISKRIPSFKKTIIVIVSSIAINYITAFIGIFIIKILVEIVYLIFFGKYVGKVSYKESVLDTLIVYLILCIIFQMISMYLKGINIDMYADKNLLATLILNIDYYVLMILTMLYSLKGRRKLYYVAMALFRILPKHKSNKQSSQKVKEKIIIEGVAEDDIKLFILFTIILTIFQLSLTFVVSYYVHNTIINTIIIIASFMVMRSYLGKSYHSDSIMICTLMTVLTFNIATAVSPPMYVSILGSVIVGSIVAIIMYGLYKE